LPLLGSILPENCSVRQKRDQLLSKIPSLANIRAPNKRFYPQDEEFICPEKRGAENAL